MENYRNLSNFCMSLIENTMSHTHIFFSKMRMIFHFKKMFISILKFSLHMLHTLWPCFNVSCSIFLCFQLGSFTAWFFLGFTKFFCTVWNFITLFRFTMWECCKNRKSICCMLLKYILYIIQDYFHNYLRSQAKILGNLSIFDSDDLSIYRLLEKNICNLIGREEYNIARICTVSIFVLFD